MKRALGMAMAMAVAGWAAAVVAQTAGAKAQVRVTSDPAGAMVSCDGVLQDATPLTIRDLDPSPHLIVVEKPGFNEVRKTLSLLPGQRSALELKLEPINGLVLIESAPEGVEIEIGGAHRGRAPLLLTDLPLGRYRLKASSTGYVTREVEFQVESRIPQKVAVELASDSAQVAIESTPPGAAVTVNGLSRGTTPCTVDRLPSGDNRIALVLADYLPFEQAVKLQAGEAQTIKVTLKPVPASLSVMSTPSGARIFVDNEVRGQTPLAIETIEPGVHTVRAELAGCESQTLTVEIGRAQAKVQDIQLVRKTGVLELVTDPPGVGVVVDGQDEGVTEPTLPEAASQVLKMDLLEGEHRLQLSKKGFYSADKTITVKRNETVVVREVMKRKFIADTVVRTRGTPPDAVTGILSKKQPNGDVVIETKPGIFKTIKAEDVLAVDSLPPDPKN